MDMSLDKLFAEFGNEMLLKKEDGWKSEIFHGFIQPLRYKNKIYLNGVNTVIGFNDEGNYLYIGPAEHDITQLDGWIEMKDKKYTIDRAEYVYCKNSVIYIWAIIREISEVE